MSDPFADVLLKALRSDLHDNRQIMRKHVTIAEQQLEVTHKMCVLLEEIREELAASRDERATHSNGSTAHAIR